MEVSKTLGDTILTLKDQQLPEFLNMNQCIKRLCDKELYNEFRITNSIREKDFLSFDLKKVSNEIRVFGLHDTLGILKQKYPEVLSYDKVIYDINERIDIVNGNLKIKLSGYDIKLKDK